MSGKSVVPGDIVHYLTLQYGTPCVITIKRRIVFESKYISLGDYAPEYPPGSGSLKPPRAVPVSAIPVSDKNTKMPGTNMTRLTLNQRNLSGDDVAIPLTFNFRIKLMVVPGLFIGPN